MLTAEAVITCVFTSAKKVMLSSVLASCVVCSYVDRIVQKLLD